MELARTTPEQYEKLKKLGFPINSTSKHPTPTLAFSLKWMRDVKKLRYGIGWESITVNEKYEEWFTFTVFNTDDKIEKKQYDSYEKAESALLDYATNALLETKNLWNQ